ncbi:hypothetical protein BDZ89DRAFT_1113615 [Hymenopellis radicata]|nr:hypothetical protein BDZ89DRAFT_1113615 [Hymenopellis radicata]
MSTLFNDLAFSFPLEESFENWQLQTLRGTATHPTLGEVATLSGYMIYRRMLGGDFLAMMDEESQELHEFSVTLFDKNGLLRPRFKAGYRSGTGCWGDELNEDALAYIEDITVKDEYRRRGIGSQLLQGLLESKYKPQISNVICWPSTKDGAAPKAFFIKNGFRRIGRTQFFGYSMDAEHPAHQILASDDVQQSVREAGQNPNEISDNIKRERQRKFPIHCAIVSNMSDSIAQVIRRSHKAELYAPDDAGFLPMHIAVQARNMIAFKTLLTLGHVEDLQNHHNADGATPLELLRDNMVNGREFMETLLSANWLGYADIDLSMEYAVKTAMGMDTGCATVQDYIAQNKHGCTCGRCLGGWLSPRMIFQLSVQAAFCMDNMPLDEVFVFKKRQVLDSSDIIHLYSGEFIPPSLYPNLSLSFYRGFTAVFRAAYEILEDVFPFTAETVLSHARYAYYSETINFFRKGGMVEYALDAITSNAKDQSMVGDREFYATFADDDEFVALPTCANDNEFELVRRMVGLDSEKKWAPYRRYRQPDEDDSDDMDDDDDSEEDGDDMDDDDDEDEDDMNEDDDDDEDEEDDDEDEDDEDFGRRGPGGMPDSAVMIAFLERMAEAR